MLYIKEEMSSHYSSNTNTQYYFTAPSAIKRPRSPPPLQYTLSEIQEDLATTEQPSINEEEDIQDIPLLNTQEEFIQAIKKWVATDNQLRILNARIKESRENRQLLTQQIHQYVEDNNLDYPSIEISDGELILCEKREYSSLSFSYIDHCLSQLIKEPTHVERIMSSLRENRECYLVPDIRRSHRK
jgi:hypothetical protein